MKRGRGSGVEGKTGRTPREGKRPKGRLAVATLWRDKVGMFFDMGLEGLREWPNGDCQLPIEGSGRGWRAGSSALAARRGRKYMNKGEYRWIKVDKAPLFFNRKSFRMVDWHRDGCLNPQAGRPRYVKSAGLSRVKPKVDARMG